MMLGFMDLGTTVLRDEGPGIRIIASGRGREDAATTIYICVTFVHLSYYRPCSPNPGPPKSIPLSS